MDLEGDQVAGGNPATVGTGGITQLVRPTDAHAIHHIVGNLRCCDFTAQGMGIDRVWKTLEQRAGKSGIQGLGETIVVNNRSSLQRLLQFNLGVGNQHRKLRASQPRSTLSPRAEFLVVGQKFEGPIKFPLCLQPPHQAFVLVRSGNRPRGGQAQSHGLTVIVPQHQLRHFRSHCPEHLVTLPQRHLSASHLLVEQDLDVYFMVRTVHPTGIINKVGIGGTTGSGKTDASKLGETEVSALTKDPAL